MVSAESSVLVDALLCESVTEQQMGSEILVKSMSERPSCSASQPLIDTNVDLASVPDRCMGLSRMDNAGGVSCNKVTESCTVDRDGLAGEHENANVLEPGNMLIGQWGLSRCSLIESQRDVVGPNGESERICVKEGEPLGEDGSASSFGDCEIPLEVIPQTASPRDGIQQDEQRDGKSLSCLSSEGVREVTEVKGDIFSEMKNDILELVSPLQAGEIPSELAGMEACSSPQQEEKGFNIICAPSLDAACEESVISAAIETDLCNRTSPARDGGMPSEILSPRDLLSNFDWMTEQMDDNGVSGLSNLSPGRTTEVVEIKSNTDMCDQILPLQGFQATLEDLHMPDSLSSCAEQIDQKNVKIIEGSMVAAESLEAKNDADVEAVMHTQILPLKVDVYYSEEGSSKLTPSSIIDNSVPTSGISSNSANEVSADRVTDIVEMKNNIDACNQILPLAGCQTVFAGSHVSDYQSVCAQENGQRNDKVIDFPSAKSVTEFVEKKSDATTDINVDIGGQILLIEGNGFNLKEGCFGLSPNSIHEKSGSLQSFQTFDIVNNGSSERLDVLCKNESPGHVDSSIPFDRSKETDHEGNDSVRVDCVSNTQCPDIVAFSSRRSGRSRKTQTKRPPRKCRNTSRVSDPLGSVEIAFKAAGRKRSCLNKPARSSIWGLLGNVTQSFEENNRLEAGQGQNQGSQKRRVGQRSGKRNQSGSSGNPRGLRGKSRSSTNLRLKVKVGKEVFKGSFYITSPEVLDNSVSADYVEKENDIEGNWRKEAIVGEDKSSLVAPVLDGDLANKDLESVVLTENSAEDVIDNFPGVSSHTIAAVSSGGSVGTCYRDPGTSPDSEVTNLVPDADVEARSQEDCLGIILTSDKVLSASGDIIGTKRGKKKHKVPAENCIRIDGTSCPGNINKEKPSKKDRRRQNKSQQFFPSETFTSSICANASSNSSSDLESSLEPRLSGKTNHGISRDALKEELGAEAKAYCNLDVGLGLSKSQSSKTKGLKPPKGRSRGCDSESKKGNADRLREDQKKPVNKKKFMEKAVCDQAEYKVESLPESGDHLVGGISKADSVDDAACINVPNLDMVPVGLDKQYLPPRNAWVLCDDCHKWRRISAELADIIDELKCTWTCRDNKDKAFAHCSIPQEKSNSEINAELDISDASGDEDASGTRLNYKELELRRSTPTVSQQNVASIKANQFLHRSRKTQTIDEIMVCHCKLPSDGQLGCGEDCLNRMLNIECIRGACPCRDLCSNQQFQKRRYAKLEKFQSGKKGFGLKLVEDIFKGQFLIEYVGEVLDTNAYEARQKEYALKGHRHFYFMTLNGSEVIDACAKGNLGRFINHSCDPNCRTEKWMVNGEICIGLFALRDIKKGEEVTFDYNYVRVFGAAAKKCYCGSDQCRGYIGGDPLDTEVIVQDDSDEEYVEPVMIPEDGVPEVRWGNTLPRATSFGGGVIQRVDSVSTDKETEKSTISVGELEFSTPTEESVNASESVVSHIHDSLELDHSRQKLPSSVQPVEASQEAEVETSIAMPVVLQETSREKEIKEKSSNSFEKQETISPIKVAIKSSSDDIGANRKTKSETTEDRKVSSKVRPNVKTSHSSSFLKGKLRITPSGNKFQVAANKSHVLSVKPKRLTEGSVEEKLNELLDGDGGINKRKDSTKGYLKLLFLTAVSGDGGNGEAIQSNRDLSMILDALLKTKSRMVLIDVINKNGLRMLHNIMKKCRDDFKKIPILRKLLKVLEYLALKQILTLEHITGGPPCPGMESFTESMLSLTEHKDKQAHQIARSFRDKWIPRPYRRHNFVDRDDSKIEFNKGSNCNRFSSSHDNWRDQSGRSTEVTDCSKQSISATTNVSTSTQEACSAPSTDGCPTTVTKVRKRKSRWDQPAETYQDSSSHQNKEQKIEPGPSTGIGEVALHMERVSGDNGNCSGSVHDNCQKNDETQMNIEDVPPGFSSIGSSSSCPSKCPTAAIGHPQEKFFSCIPVSYGIPLSVMQQFGTPHAETFETWVVAPGIPFHPFPPLPPFPRRQKGLPPHNVNHVPVHQPAAGQLERCVPATFYSEESTPSTTGVNEANFGLPCASNHFQSKRARGFSNDLGRTYFKQQKYWNNSKFRPPTTFNNRNEWGCNGNNSRVGTTGIGVGNVGNELINSYCSEDLSYRVEKAGNNVNQQSHNH